MKEVRPLGKSKNIIVTIAIGDAYLQSWTEKALPSWIRYAEKYDLGLFVIDQDLVPKSNKYWKKATWQKTLIGDSLREFGIDANNVCYLDSDILISPGAPDIFISYHGESIGLVSLMNGLPYERIKLLKKTVALRQVFIDPTYPEDSAILLDAEGIYANSNLPKQRDFACMGLILFNVALHSEYMKQIFYKYTAAQISITGGDQTHYNYEFFSGAPVQLLDYRFQVIWQYELACFYPFLYDQNIYSKELLSRCIENTMETGWFIHFAGTWVDGTHWRHCNLFEDEKWNKFHDKYEKLIRKEITPRLYGRL